MALATKSTITKTHLTFGQQPITKRGVSMLQIEYSILWSGICNWAVRLCLSVCLCLTLASPSQAKHHHHSRQARYHDGRPSAWCGWWMRQALGVADRAYNLAANWAHWGRAASPSVGVVVVWRHHVGRIVGGSPGHWVVESGNDGHAVRRRERSVAGAIAFRQG